MKYLKDILRLLIISPEITLILLVMAFFLGKPDWFLTIGTQFKTNEEIWKFLPFFPLLFTGTAIKFGGKIRAPLENSSNKILYEWPEYYKIQNRVLISYYICILCSIGAIAIWLFASILSPSVIGAIYAASVLISGVTAFCMILALPKLKEILETYK